MTDTFSRARTARALPLVVTFGLAACRAPNDRLDVVNEAVGRVAEEYAPDRRVARLEVRAEIRDGEIVLTGDTNLPRAKNALLSILSKRGIDLRDEIAVLPTEDLRETPHAVVAVSVANLRSAPRHPAELATQATLGTPLRVLKREGDFYLVQTPDGYLAWVDKGGVHLLSAGEFDRLRGEARLIYLQPYGFAYREPRRLSRPVSDLVIGSLLGLDGEEGEFFRVHFPDGRRAYVSRLEAQSFDDWLSQVEISGPAVVATAYRLMGVPYLWGGTSSKALDCSGFVKLVYFLHGMILPRDASQQVRTGILVDEAGDFSRLEPGDLLFFGRPASATHSERIEHVGIWTDDLRYIHASGRVRVNSMDPGAADYDAFNRQRYLQAKRILGPSAPGRHDLRDGALFRLFPGR